MTKQLKFVVAAVLGACLLVSASAAFARNPVERRVDGELRRARAKADARIRRAADEVNRGVRRATAQADRAARQAGVRITAPSRAAAADNTPRRKGALRREALRRSIERKLPGGDRRPGRR